MTIDEILAEGREAARKRDAENPLSAKAQRAVELDLGIEFGSMLADDQDRMRHGMEEDPYRTDDERIEQD